MEVVRAYLANAGLRALVEYARRLGCDQGEADDLAQDTAARGLERCEQLRDPERVGGWLKEILLNRRRETFRRSAARPEVHIGRQDNLPDKKSEGWVTSIEAADEWNRVLDVLRGQGNYHSQLLQILHQERVGSKLTHSQRSQKSRIVDLLRRRLSRRHLLLWGLGGAAAWGGPTQAAFRLADPFDCDVIEALLAAAAELRSGAGALQKRRMLLAPVVQEVEWHLARRSPRTPGEAELAMWLLDAACLAGLDAVDVRACRGHLDVMWRLRGNLSSAVPGWDWRLVQMEARLALHQQQYGHALRWHQRMVPGDEPADLGRSVGTGRGTAHVAAVAFERGSVYGSLREWEQCRRWFPAAARWLTDHGDALGAARVRAQALRREAQAFRHDRVRALDAASELVALGADVPGLVAGPLYMVQHGLCRLAAVLMAGRDTDAELLAFSLSRVIAQAEYVQGADRLGIVIREHANGAFRTHLAHAVESLRHLVRRAAAPRPAGGE